MTFFRNKGDLTFEPVEKAWGTDTPSFSNGAAYADLDNDGDLDLVVNNLAAEAFVYPNHTNDKRKDHHYLKVKVQGDALNTHAIGTKITFFYHVGNLFLMGYTNLPNSEHKS